MNFAKRATTTPTPTVAVAAAAAASSRKNMRVSSPLKTVHVHDTPLVASSSNLRTRAVQVAGGSSCVLAERRRRRQSGGDKVARITAAASQRKSQTAKKTQHQSASRVRVDAAPAIEQRPMSSPSVPSSSRVTREEYDTMYKRSLDDPDGFWSDIADDFYWKDRWETKHHHANIDVKKGTVDITWFKGATTNICYNCVDRHVESGNGDKNALLWEGNAVGDDATMTYSQLKDEVCKTANYLISQGVKRGDRVVIYMPMILELPITMLACARIGAVHSVVFGGFSAEALSSRIVDSEAKIVLTCSATMRGAKMINLKGVVDSACSQSEKSGMSVDRVVVVNNEAAVAKGEVAMVDGRDVFWEDVIPQESTSAPIEWMGSEDPLFLLYTSGSTGKPKGVLHTTGGYMVYAATTFRYAFDHTKDDIYWCTADCGWITGHSYLTYGPLLNCSTSLVFEGVPTYPDAGRCWEVCDKWGVTLFYTAPTAIRSLQRAGDEFVTKHKRSTLRVLGTVGEPINPEAFRWYNEVVGDGRCPIVDTWWQTETGGHMIMNLPGAWPQKPGSATLPFFGVEPAILNEKGEEQTGACEGVLALKRSHPGGMRTLYNDHERFETTYWAPYPGYYFTGDGARRDDDGYYWITGRVDDVINVSGHRIGTAEVESALVENENCTEAAVVGYEHPVKGQGIYAYVTLKNGVEYSEDLRKALKNEVRSRIGPFASPDIIHWAPGLPKTRSGKIMRRVLRKIASKEESQLGDTSTLADPSVVDTLIELRGK